MKFFSCGISRIKKSPKRLYYKIIERKTAALFESCAAIGAESANASDEEVEAARLLVNISELSSRFVMISSIIVTPEAEIGKPTGNDMAEGKLTLPIIYALNSTKNEEMLALAHKVKAHEVTREEIDKLVEFAKVSGGIEYAERRMWDSSC